MSNKKAKSTAEVAVEGQRVLYVIAGSPYAWPVEALLAHSGLAHDVVYLSASDGETRAAAHLARNPRGKVPVLQEPQGFCVYESAAIIAYLLSVYPAQFDALLPADGRERAQAFTRMMELTATSAPILRSINIFQNKQREGRAAGHDDLVRALNSEVDLWETKYLTGPYAAGSAGLSFADFPVFCFFAFLRRLGYKFGDNISAYLTGLESLEAFKKTWPSHWKGTDNKDWLAWLRDIQ